MSVPALRQPKAKETTEKPKTVIKSSDVQYVIITLKDEKKLVVNSDSYHGILTSGDLYKCVLCVTDMVLDPLCKERHKNSSYHKKVLESFPHIEDFAENLVRELDRNRFYCTICNVVVLSPFITRHIASEAHIEELDRAGMRSGTYKQAF